jgi:transcriptional regulator with XRE-family HTH domain
MPESSKNNISKTVKRLREKMGLSQEKLARLADVSNNTIINIEAGKQNNPTIETLKKIAKALEVGVDDLING